MNLFLLNGGTRARAEDAVDLADVVAKSLQLGLQRHHLIARNSAMNFIGKSMPAIYMPGLAPASLKTYVMKQTATAQATAGTAICIASIKPLQNSKAMAG